MTIFYVILYKIYLIRYQKKDHKTLSTWVYSLAVVRIVLCLFPQNEWLNYNQPLNWSIYRNIPFAVLGIMMIPKTLAYVWVVYMGLSGLRREIGRESNLRE